MPAEHLLATAAGGRAVHLETQIERYAKPFRKRLRKLAKTSSRLGDLMSSFPAASFALVSNYGPVAGRGEAVKLVKDGASLNRVADALGLPRWTRRLPPETFVDQIPAGIAAMDAEFARRVIPSVPERADAAAGWLAWTSAGHKAGGTAFAEWLAKQAVFEAAVDANVDLTALPVSVLGAYAWASERDSVFRRKLLIDWTWNKHRPFRMAAGQAASWIRRVVTERCMPARTRGGSWHKAQRVRGFNVVPLLNAEALQDEGQRMNHCVGTYADSVAAGRCLVYAIRRGSQGVATFEVVPSKHDYGAAEIVQIQGPGNSTPQTKAVSAAQEWLARQGQCPLTLESPRTLSMAMQRDKWDAFWTPYWTCVGEQPGLGSTPSSEEVRALFHDLTVLERLTKRC
ncbi:MAG: PcfJ domain-containing protein [Pseudomonadota bacterium]